MNKDVPEGAIAVGIPCRIITKEHTSEMRYLHDELEVLQSCGNTDNCP